MSDPNKHRSIINNITLVEMSSGRYGIGAKIHRYSIFVAERARVRFAASRELFISNCAGPVKIENKKQNQNPRRNDGKNRSVFRSCYRFLLVSIPKKKQKK